MRLQGRVAAITGGALGIGRATARLFAAEGAAVVLGDVQVEEAEAVAKEITQAGGRALAVGVDVGEAGQVQAFVDRAVAELARHRLRRVRLDVRHRDDRALLREEPRGGAPDAERPPGDRRDPSLQAHHAAPTRAGGRRPRAPAPRTR